MTKQRSTFARDYIGYEFYVLLKLIVCALPLSWLYWFACRVGGLMYIFSRRNRNGIERNLGIGLKMTDVEIKHCTRAIFTNFCKNTIDFLRFPCFDNHWLDQQCQIIGRENLDAALAKGKGVIIVSAHLGNPEIAALLVTHAGFTISGIWASHKNHRVEQFFLKPRLARGIKVILTGGAMEQALRALRKNEIVAFVIDYAFGGKGRKVDFFGHSSMIPRGAAVAAIHSGAAIIPAVAVRLEPYGYKMLLGKEVAYSISGDEQKDITDIMQKSLAAIEPFICDYPEQWVLFNDCWPNNQPQTVAKR